MHNYKYNKIGNLVADKSEEIEEISWTMQGKVKEIRRTTGSQKPDLVFNYDGLGNRVSKTVIPKSSVNNEDSITTYYIRDAQGNILATYEKTKYKNGDEKFYLKEQYLYGSSRIGMNVSNLLLASNVNGSVEIKEYDGYFTKTVGNKRFELTNHLGNVLAVVSDKKGADNEPDVVSVSDYYPFGMQMPGRSFNANSYRHGYNTQEKTDEVAGTGNHYTAQYWEYNPQVVQRWNLDPKPNPSISFYATFAGNPIINNDILGDTLTASAEKWAGEMESEIGKRLKKADPKSKEAKELNVALKELDILRNSTQIYDVRMFNRDGSFGEVVNKGEVSYDTNNDMFVIGLNENTNNRASIGEFAHEFKHAYQFEMGQMSFTTDGNKGGKLYDYTDEVEAHRRGGWFGAEKTPDRSYLRLPIPYQAINELQYRKIRVQKELENDIFRLDKVTYKP